MKEWTELLDLPRLLNLKLGGNAFNNAVLMKLRDLLLLASIEYGSSCFYSAPSFVLRGSEQRVVSFKIFLNFSH